MRQTSFGFLKDYKKEFGGSLLLGRRKSKRPLSTKAPIHLIFKANKSGVFNPSSPNIQSLIRKTALQFDIQIYDLAVNWSHIHLLIRLRDRRDYIKFVRAICSLLASLLKTSKLFTLRPFTRILCWGRDFKTALEYLALNQQEAFGLIDRKKGRRRPEKIVNGTKVPL